MDFSRTDSWMTRPASAVRLPPAVTTGCVARATCPSLSATGPASSDGCSPAGPANTASLNAPAHPCSARVCPRTRPLPCCSTSRNAAASVPPAALSASIKTPSYAMPFAPATTPTNCMMNWWAFPPNTRNVQFDEKWSFVGKKQKHCDALNPEDDFQGDHWDHVAFDPDHRLVVSLVCGQRTEEHTLLLVQDFHDRTEGRLMDLMTSDEYPLYASAIHTVYGEEIVPERTGKPGRPK